MALVLIPPNNLVIGLFSYIGIIWGVSSEKKVG
jgi:hypothetical protein